MPSFTDVFLRHYRELVTYLTARTGSRHVAQDCVQDTWEKLARLDPAVAPDHVKAYVFRVASNVAMDWHRSQASHARTIAAYAATASSVTLAPDTFDVVAFDQTLRRLEAAMLLQPRRSVQIFLFNRHDGLSYAQLAARFSISVSAVEKHMMRMLLACDAVLRE